MQLATLESAGEGPGRIDIPVRGHRFRDWIMRLARRFPHPQIENPPNAKRLVDNDELRIEVALPGFRAAEIEVVCEDDRLSLSARRSVTKKGRTDTRVAHLEMTIEDRFDVRRGSADLLCGCLAVKFPLRESLKVRRIPIASR